MIKKILLTVGALLVVGAGVLYFAGVAPTYAPEACSYDLDIARLRSLAASMPGNKPSEIRVEDVTGSEFSRAVACPGESWDKVQFRVYAYQLVFDDKTIVVDTAMNRASEGDRHDRRLRRLRVAARRQRLDASFCGVRHPRAYRSHGRCIRR
jgi:hypothetical protein